MQIDLALVQDHPANEGPDALEDDDLATAATWNARMLNGVTTFATVTTTLAPVADIKKKRVAAGCYVTTVNGSQDKITRTVCPAPAPTCTRCVGCGVPQC